MIEHLRGRDRKLEPLGWDRPARGMDHPGLPSQRRLHAGAILSLLQRATDDGKPFCERIG